MTINKEDTRVRSNSWNSLRKGALAMKGIVK